MKTFLPIVLALSQLANLAIPQGLPGDFAPQLSLELKPGHRLLVRWQAATGTTRLVWTNALGNPTPWQPLAGVVPMGGEAWQAEFPAVLPKAFFTLHPPGLPVAPPNVRLVPVGDHFQLEWDSTSDAGGYVVYVGLDPTVGPGNSIMELALPSANAVEIEGLTPGQTYYIAIAATNAAGQGALSPVVSGVFGPKGVLSGTAVQSFTLSSGQTFDVLAEGATINIIPLANPAGLVQSMSVDANGQFRFPNLPAGDYLVGYGFQGQAGFLPNVVTLPAGGTALTPLIIPSGPVPPPPGSTLVGTVALSNGDAPRIDLDEFDIHERVQMHALLSSGEERIVHPDRNGAWALTDLHSTDYPMTLTAEYHGLHKSTVVAAPPLEFSRIDIVFSETMPVVQRIAMFQDGHEVQSIARGVPVTFVAEIESAPDGVPAEPRWIAQFNGQKYLGTGNSATFVFTQPAGPSSPGLGDPQDSALVQVTLIPSGTSLGHVGTIGAPIDIAGVGCWSGLVGQWSPFGPNVINPVHPATIKVTHSGPLSPVTGTTINTNAGGYFEMPVDPTTVPPYVVRVDAPGFMRFLWPFEQRLPSEANYCVTAAITSLQSQNPSGPRVFTHPLGGTITIPWGEVLDPFNQNWYGDIVVKMTIFDPYVRSPLPPGAEVRGPNFRNGIFTNRGVWFDITDQSGVPLVPTAACTLTIPSTPSLNPSFARGYHQDETTGYFERWGYLASPFATNIGGGQFTITLGTKGLFLIGDEGTLIQELIIPDRTLGYPFDVLVNNAVFPITVQGYNQLSTGKLYIPINYGCMLHVLDQRQAPGLRYANPTSTGLYVAPMQKVRIISKPMNVTAFIPPYPQVGSAATYVSLNDSEPKLTSITPTINALNSATHFLARFGPNTAADAQDYYNRINAPATLSQWRTINGLPARFGGPLTGVSADDYATAYYYNLGDLGFARAQTMRIKLSTIDGGYDTAYAVTNYRSIDDAICGRGAIATVCMDFAKRYDTGSQTASRYTRFYVYASDGSLTKEADLDGAGLKGVPNLCVICHGGNFWDTTNPNRTTNLGSRFLPFDLEAFTYHPKFGVQQAELARMNKGVLLTSPTAAIADLIAGWYGNPNPLANLFAFNYNYFPNTGSLSWFGNPNVYVGVFKPVCRGVCHTSRETTGYMQFSSLAAFQVPNYGYYPALNSLQMPHSRRTWSIFWGSRCAANIGQPAADMPTIMGAVSGNPYR